ncbi:MAG: hypothetical protein WC390_06725 [Sulfurimonas sp.]|jgi:hypothetical protein
MKPTPKKDKMPEYAIQKFSLSPPENQPSPKTRSASQQQTIDIPEEKKWSLVHGLLMDLLADEIEENTEHLGNITKNVDMQAVLITSWLDYLASTYIFMSGESEGARTKKAKQEHAELDDYADRAIDTYLTAKHALLYFKEDGPKTKTDGLEQ